VVLGFDNGDVQISLRGGTDIPWQRFWRLKLHQGECGSQVSAVVFSFDLEHCFSCGIDGNEFMFRLSPRHFGDPPPVPLPSKKANFVSSTFLKSMDDIICFCSLLILHYYTIIHDFFSHHLQIIRRRNFTEIFIIILDNIF
jgi:hypothetical protein